jgi:peptidyl-prolyl cis-trans isomerase C/foldase protein PrsA
LLKLAYAFLLLVLAAAFFAVPFGSGCSNDEHESSPGPRAVAIVNGEAIALADFQEALDEIRSVGKGFFVDKERANSLKRDLLERMIDTRLLLQEARRRRIVLDPKVAEASLDLARREYPPGGLEEELLKKGKSVEAYLKETGSSLLLRKLLKREVVDRIAVSREEVEKYYEEHRDKFRKPEEVRVRQIVTKSEEEAEKLRKMILRGAKFEELARKHSLGPEAKKGGDLGYFPRGRMPPAIEEACFKLWSSHVSRVAASPYGFHLFQLVDRRAARELSLDDAAAEIERKLVDEKTREAETYYIRSLREKASIQRDLSLLDKVH